ncbi:MAG TPA: dUTP diphosphatase [Elusimicrobiales bacterium]|nr:dUTP diphosphatase [Elusimicrobiales bacterium]
MVSEILVKKLNEDAKLPNRAHENDSGADLFTLCDITIMPHMSTKIPTGICIALPEKTSGLVWGKSSLESKGLKVVAGLIDAGYRGEVLVCMFNLTNEPIKLTKGQKIAQLLVMPTYYPKFKTSDTLPDSNRGEGGFGSTGSH